MITDRETNTIYISKLLKTLHPGIYNSIVITLSELKIEVKELEKTKDIWARDYMPIQVSSNKFIEFRFDPDYLQGKEKGYRDLKTYPDIVCEFLNLNNLKSDIILDGGNVIKSDDCVILTEKVFFENRLNYSKKELIIRLSQLFNDAKIVIIPWDKINDEYGHSDGMVRFIDNKQVLVSEEYEKDDKLLKTLTKNGLEPQILKVKIKRRSKFNWAYINFLQTKDVILIPKFGVEEDDKAFDVISSYFSEYANNKRIAQIEMSEIAAKNGALNCISWTIKV